MNMTFPSAFLPWLRCLPFPVTLSLCLWAQVAASQARDLLVADLSLQVAGTSGGQQDAKAPFATQYYGFPAGDVLLLDLEPQAGKATYILEVVDYASGSPLFSSRQVKKIKNLRLPLIYPAK